tara:strand:- start:90 stop:326 length:237 start_codon:yes stop_codon:yes gene_type:complete
MEDIKPRLVELIAMNLDIDESRVTDDASFIDDLGADSLDTVELVMALEEEYGIEIDDEEAEVLKTFGDVHKFVLEKIG